MNLDFIFIEMRYLFIGLMNLEGNKGANGGEKEGKGGGMPKSNDQRRKRNTRFIGK